MAEIPSSLFLRSHFLIACAHIDICFSLLLEEWQAEGPPSKDSEPQLGGTSLKPILLESGSCLKTSSKQQLQVWLLLAAVDNAECRLCCHIAIVPSALARYHTKFPCFFSSVKSKILPIWLKIPHPAQQKFCLPPHSFYHETCQVDQCTISITLTTTVITSPKETLDCRRHIIQYSLPETSWLMRIMICDTSHLKYYTMQLTCARI